MLTYRIGDGEHRPWGSYEIIDSGFLSDGREYCDKILMIRPFKILSLQSHDFRNETWRVDSGTLSAISNWRTRKITQGHKLHISARTVHTIANLERTPLVLHERQTGICRENDIIRYADRYGRVCEKTGPAWLFYSLRLYKNMISEIELKEQK